MRGYKYFLDTNIFLRVIVKDDTQKAKDCEELIAALNQKKIRAITSSMVIAELVWTSFSVYRLTKTEVVRVLRGILGIKNLKFQDKMDFIDAVDKFETTNAKFIDTLISSHPAIANRQIKVVSYDRDFDKLGVVRVEPKDILV